MKLGYVKAEGYPMKITYDSMDDYHWVWLDMGRELVTLAEGHNERAVLISARAGIHAMRDELAAFADELAAKETDLDAGADKERER